MLSSLSLNFVVTAGKTPFHIMLILCVFVCYFYLNPLPGGVCVSPCCGGVGICALQFAKCIRLTPPVPPSRGEPAAHLIFYSSTYSSSPASRRAVQLSLQNRLRCLLNIFAAIHRVFWCSRLSHPHCGAGL